MALTEPESDSTIRPRMHFKSYMPYLLASKSNYVLPEGMEPVHGLLKNCPQFMLFIFRGVSQKRPSSRGNVISEGLGINTVLFQSAKGILHLHSHRELGHRAALTDDWEIWQPGITDNACSLQKCVNCYSGTKYFQPKRSTWESLCYFAVLFLAFIIFLDIFNDCAFKSLWKQAKMVYARGRHFRFI